VSLRVQAKDQTRLVSGWPVRVNGARAGLEQN
jgi:hypothetical protein